MWEGWVCIPLAAGCDSGVEGNIQPVFQHRLGPWALHVHHKGQLCTPPAPCIATALVGMCTLVLGVEVSRGTFCTLV